MSTPPGRSSCAPFGPKCMSLTPGIPRIPRWVLRTLYPADRAIFSTGVKPESLIAIRWLSELKCNDGNVVVRVRPGGTGFRIEVTSSKDESDEVIGSFGPFECESRVQRPLDPVGQNATRRGMRSRGRKATLGVMTICGGRELLRGFERPAALHDHHRFADARQDILPVLRARRRDQPRHGNARPAFAQFSAKSNRLESRDSALLGLLRQFHAELGSGPVFAGGMG